MGKFVFVQYLHRYESSIYSFKKKTKKECCNYGLRKRFYYEAENRLFEELECDEEGIFEAALGFYDYLNSLPEEFLEEHNYTRDEVKEGAQSLADRKGLGVLE